MTIDGRLKRFRLKEKFEGRFIKAAVKNDIAVFDAIDKNKSKKTVMEEVKDIITAIENGEKEKPSYKSVAIKRWRKVK